ncbi:hypothetical protein COOONC_12271 [Cooperia oncophora]
MKKKKKKESNGSGDSTLISVVLVDTDYRSNSEEGASSQLAQPGWYVYAPQLLATKSRLLRALGFEFPPSLIVVDTASRTVVTTEGRRLLADDVNGTSFPWWPPAALEVLRGNILRRVNGVVETSDFSTIKTTVRGLLFGAQWMPWPAFAYDPSKTIALTRVYNISGIPSLILLDSSGRVITNHGRSSLLEDPAGRYFPWGPRPLYELNEYTVCRLRDEPSLILFTERMKIEERRQEEAEKKSDESAEQGNGLSKSASSEECSSTGSDLPIPPQADPLQLLYTGEDPICDHILESILGLGDVELPLICIVDGLAGHLCVCDRPDVSEAVLDEFVAEYRAGRLQWTPLPAADQNAPKSVGGIPSAIIEQALISHSPSQNSMGGGGKEEVKAV